MSPQTVRILIAGALFVHGVGHILGFWKPPTSFSPVKISLSSLRFISGIAWVMIAIGFTASAMSFWSILIPQSSWRALVIVFSFASLVCLVLFGRSWPKFNFIAASAMNIVIITAILWFH